jgi:hypothetical protein
MAIKFPGTTDCGIISTCIGPQATAVGPPIQTGFNQNSGAGGITSIAFTMASSVTAGNAIIVFVQAAAVPTAVPTDTIGNTYVLYKAQVNGNFGMWAYVATSSIGSGSNTVTASLTSQSTVATMVVAEYPKGVQIALSIDVNVNSATGTTTGSTVNLGCQYYAEQCVVCAIGNSVLGTSAAGSGFTGRITSAGTTAAVLLEDQYLTTPTLVTCAGSNIGSTVSGVWTTIALGVFARTGPPSVNFAMTFWVKYDVTLPESSYIQVCFNNIVNPASQIGWTGQLANDVQLHMLTTVPTSNGSATYNTAVVLNQWTFVYVTYWNGTNFSARVLNFGSSTLLASEAGGAFSAPTTMPSDIICFGNEFTVDAGSAGPPNGTSLPIMTNTQTMSTLAVAYPRIWSNPLGNDTILTDQEVLAESRSIFPVRTKDLFAFWQFTSPDGTNVDWSVSKGVAAGLQMKEFASGGKGTFVADPILPSPLRARALPMGI